LKQSGQCPKCSSRNIWNNSHIQIGGIRPSKGWVLVRKASRWNYKYVFKDDYVCIDCGYSETFIDDDGMKTIREYGVTELGQ
jgi:predicted nucleic-acid-binding Zn-ribbon protein